MQGTVFGFITKVPCLGSVLKYKTNWKPEKKPDAIEKILFVKGIFVYLQGQECLVSKSLVSKRGNVIKMSLNKSFA